jgi:hypothetical protein
LLEGLGQIDWASLNHAYGSAEDVPRLIGDLTSGSKEQREKALWELYGNIWHQHTVYEATAPAVPFLAEVALAEGVPDETRNGVTLLLADIADGESYLEVHGDFLESTGVQIDRSTLQQELEWAAAAHQAVREVSSRFWRCLDADADPGCRLAATYLASSFPEDGESLVPRLRPVHDAEPDPVARAALALALTLLGEERPEYLDELGSLPDTEVDHEAVGELRQGGEAASDLGKAILSDLVTSSLTRLAG